MTNTLAGFTETTFTYNGETKTVFRAGSGPGIVVMSEIPGITPKVAGFAQRLVDAGFTVALPDLFGTPGREPSFGYIVSSITKACISREFSNWALNRTSPVIDWLRALARDLHEQCGGPGVGAIGMCFTGGFALAMAVDDTMLAPVLSQPSLPFPGGKRRKRALGLSDADLARVVEREDLCLLAMRFTDDPAVRPERFEHLPRRLRRPRDHDRDRQQQGQPAQFPPSRALGRDRASRRRAGQPHEGRPRPCALVLPGKARVRVLGAPFDERCAHNSQTIFPCVPREPSRLNAAGTSASETRSEISGSISPASKSRTNSSWVSRTSWGFTTLYSAQCTPTTE